MTIGASIERFEKDTPDKIAIRCGREAIAWGAMAPIVRRLSNWLCSSAAHGEAVGISLPNCAALPLIFLAAARSGLNAVVLDPAWPAAMQRDACTSLNAKLIFASSKASETSIRHAMPDPNRSIEFLSELTSGASEHCHPRAGEDDIFYTGFTSGSSGRPKAFSRNHRSWIESFDAEQKEFGHEPADVIVAPGNLTHSLFLYAVVRALHIGATAVAMPAFRPNAIAPAIADNRGTILYGAPSQLAMLVRSSDATDGFAFPYLRWIVSSGSKWSDSDRELLRDTFPGTRLAEFYGASELSFVSIARDDENPPTGSVGRAFANVEIDIVDADGARAPPGANGEIFVRSPMTFDGYAQGEDAPSLRRRGEFVSVGDMGYCDDRGFLFLTGRRDRMIVSAGKNLFPEEIEQALAAHPSVAKAAVIGAADSLRGKRLVMFVEPAAGRQVGGAELIAFLRTRLPLYKVPRRYFSLDIWPQTRSGKTDYPALQDMFATGRCEPLP